MPKCNFVIAKSYIENFYTKLKLQMLLRVPAQLRIVTQPRFRLKPFYVKLTAFLFSNN